MQLRPAQLASHLARGLAPLYVVHGDEPLLAIEAGDEIRAAARAAGFDEREILVAEPGFKWDAFAAANRNLGLFGARKLVDLAIPSGKPGVEGARALEDCAAHPHPDLLTLITLPRLDRAAQGSSWFAALERAGVTVAVQPLERRELPRWLATRLARQNQRARADTLQLLAEATRVWGKRQAALERAARRIDAAAIPDLLLRLARLDALAKGIGRGSVWNELADLALAIAGRPLPIESVTP